MADLVATAQACLDGEDIGMPASDLIEDLMHEVVRLGRDNANLQHHYKHHRVEPEAGERVQLSFMVAPELKRQLDAAANASGRSQSQEAEIRLEKSFLTSGMKLTVGMLSTTAPMTTKRAETK